MSEPKKAFYLNVLGIAAWFLVIIVIGIIHLSPFVHLILLIGLIIIGVNVWSIFKMGKEIGMGEVREGSNSG